MLPTMRPQPTRIMYTAMVIAASLFILGFLWFCLYAAISLVQASTASVMSQYDIANTSYVNYELAETFIANIWTYLLMIAVLGLGYWVYIYSQRKGQRFGY